MRIEAILLTSYVLLVLIVDNLSQALNEKGIDNLTNVDRPNSTDYKDLTTESSLIEIGTFHDDFPNYIDVEIISDTTNEEGNVI